MLVQPIGFIEANELWREFYVGAEAQAVFPGRELGSLFDLLNQGQQILIVVGYLAAVMAALTLNSALTCPFCSSRTMRCSWHMTCAGCPSPC